jgi:heptosyltransferase-2
MLRVIGKKTINRSDIRKVLVRVTNWVGDMVMCLPALEAVRTNFPDSSITVVARPWVVPLIKKHPAVDHVISYKKGDGFAGDFKEFCRVLRLIRSERFDISILFQNAFEAALLSYLGGVKNRIGYNTDGRGFLLTHSVVRDEDLLKLHQVEYYLSILRAMGWEADTKEPVLSIDDRDMNDAGNLLASEEIEEEDLLLGLSPGAIFGPAKRWPSERFAAVGDRAVESWGAKVVILGSSGETEICNDLAASMKYSSVNLCGKTSLGQAMALIRRCRFFVTNDSGLMHVAAGLDVPMVAIFGSTDHVATGPRSEKARIVRNEVDCAPCLKPECPTDFKCMLGITIDEVWRELEKLKEKIK